MLQHIHRLRSRRRAERAEEGASAVEYSLLIGAVAAVMVVVVITLGGEVQGMFEDGCNLFRGAGSCGS